jgi:methylated-DNA-[protein]-cysteine S-methyltransferase
MTLYYEVLDSPIDPLLAIVSPDGLVALEFSPVRLASARKRWTARVGSSSWQEAPRGVMAPVRDWFRAYWAGSPLPALEYRLYGTEFQVAVWKALFDVSAGSTSTYGALARRIGHPDAARAVGAAVGQNPIAIVAPCHRIVGADGSLTGFGGGLPRKKWLLAHEAAHAPLALWA